MFDKPKHSVEIGPSAKVVEISPEFIEWQDQSTFVRYGIDGDQVENLKAAYEADEVVPPVDLFVEKAVENKSDEPGDRLCYYIGDGWHRFHAVRELGRAVIPAVVHTGGRREALKFALGANAAHGLRRTNKDKRKAVEIALREFPSLSNRAIAELCKVSHVLVNDARPQLEESSSSRIGKDGKMRCVTRFESNPDENHKPAQIDFFELVGREWLPIVKGFDLTIKSVAWLDDRVAPEKKLEAISAMRRQLDGMRAQLTDRERAIKSGIGQRHQESTELQPTNQKEGVLA